MSKILEVHFEEEDGISQKLILHPLTHYLLIALPLELRLLRP
jgi:hypothetical protein